MNIPGGLGHPGNLPTNTARSVVAPQGGNTQQSAPPTRSEAVVFGGGLSSY